MGRDERLNLCLDAIDSAEDTLLRGQEGINKPMKRVAFETKVALGKQLLKTLFGDNIYRVFFDLCVLKLNKKKFLELMEDSYKQDLEDKYGLNLSNYRDV